MPVKDYFKGDGAEVMKGMTARYGVKKGKAVFYATANKRGMMPKLADTLLASPKKK